MCRSCVTFIATWEDSFLSEPQHPHQQCTCTCTHTRTHTQDLSTSGHCDYHRVKSVGVMQIVFHSGGLDSKDVLSAFVWTQLYHVVGHSSCVWAHCLTTDVSELCYILKILHHLSSQNKKWGTQNFKGKSLSEESIQGQVPAYHWLPMWV